MADDMTRTQFGAVQALLAHRFGDSQDRLHRLAFPHDQHVVVGQHDEPAGGFSHRTVQIVDQMPHHRSAVDERRGVAGRSAGEVQQFAQRRPDRRRNGHRFRNRAGDGESPGRNRFACGGPRHVDQRLRIVHHRADINGNPAGRNPPPRRQPQSDDFIAGRIDVPQNLDPHVRRQQRLQRRNRLAVLGLEGDDSFLGPRCLHRQFQPAHQQLRTFHRQLLVRPQHRFALGAVDQENLRFRRQLDMRRKSGATGADDSGRLDFFADFIHRIHPSQASKVSLSIIPTIMASIGV